MNNHPVPVAKVTLDQWRTLAAVVDAGGYARAAEVLGKSQSSVSHGIRRLEAQIEAPVMRVEGRRAVLTEVGRLALRRARFLLEEAADIERAARVQAAGAEPEIGLGVDPEFPPRLLMPALDRHGALYPNTRIDLFEADADAAAALICDGRAQLAVTPSVPEGRFGTRLIDLRTVCVAVSAHPLHTLGRALSERDLGRYRRLVRRLGGDRGPRAGGSRHAGRSMSFDTEGARLEALRRGVGFGWCPAESIRRELEEGVLKPLPLARDGPRTASHYLVFSDEEAAGAATHALANCIEAEAGAARAAGA